MNVPNPETEKVRDSDQPPASTDLGERAVHRIATAPVAANRRSPLVRIAGIVAVTACVVFLLDLMFVPTAFFGSRESANKGASASADHAGTDGREDGSSDVAIRHGVPVVALEIPSLETESRLPKSEWLPDDFVLLTGRFSKPKTRSDGETVEFLVERVLKGEVKDGKIITKDELPSFQCIGPVVISQTFPLNELFVCWLTREKSKWTVVELQKPTPRFFELFEAATNKESVEPLRELITPHGMDHETVEMIKLFASPSQVDPMLKKVIRETPALLEPYEGASGPSYDERWQQRMKLVSYRLAPALDILARHNKWCDANVVDLILPCYSSLRDQGGESLRLTLNYHLAAIARTAHYYPQELELSEHQREAIRETLSREVAGFGNRWTSTAYTACCGLAYVFDSGTIDFLLNEQLKRPVQQSHSTIAFALSQICAERDPMEDDRLKLKEAWFKTLKSFRRKETVSAHQLAESYAKSFANQVVIGLYNAKLTDGEFQSLRELYERTKSPIVHEVLSRRFKKADPPAEESPAQAMAYRFGEALVAQYSKGAKPHTSVTKQLAEFQGPKTLKLVRSQHGAQIVDSLRGSNISQLKLSYTPLSRELLTAVGKMKSLQSISVYRGDPCDQTALSELARLAALNSLEIASTKLVTKRAEGVSSIAKATSLQKLYLDSVGSLGDEHIPAIVSLKKLETIRVDSRNLSNEGLDLLSTLPHLKTVVLPRILVDCRLIDKLKKRGVEIFPRPLAGNTRVWNVDDGKQVYAGHLPDTLTFTDGGGFLAAREGEAVDLFDVKSGRLAHSFGLPLNADWRLARDTELLVWRDKKKLIAEDTLGRKVTISAFAAERGHGLFTILPGGKSIAASRSRTIKIFDAATGKLNRELTPLGNDYFSPGGIVVSRDGKRLASAGNGHPGVRVWSLPDGKERRRNDQGVVVFGFTKGGSTLLFAGPDKKELFAMNVKTGESKSVLTFPKNSQPLLNSVSNTRFAYARRQLPIVVELYDTTSWKLIRQHQFAPDDSIVASSVTLSRDGKHLAVSGNLNNR